MIAVHDSYTASIAVTSRLSSLGYSGEHFDAKAQQQYLRARFYNPANGRFNRLDLFAGNMQDPQSLHKYAYVHGDPISSIDPSGLAETLSSTMTATAVRAGLMAGSFTAILTALKGISKGAAYGFRGAHSPLNIAIDTALAFGLGFIAGFASVWSFLYVVAGGASIAGTSMAFGVMLGPPSVLLLILNLSHAFQKGDGIDQSFALIDSVLFLYSSRNILSWARPDVPAHDGTGGFTALYNKETRSAFIRKSWHTNDPPEGYLKRNRGHEEFLDDLVAKGEGAHEDFVGYTVQKLDDGNLEIMTWKSNSVNVEIHGNPDASKEFASEIKKALYIKYDTSPVGEGPSA